MKTLTHLQLVDFLKEQTNELPVTLCVTSPATLKKTGNPYKDKIVTKTVTIDGVIGKKYADEMWSISQPSSEKPLVSKGRTWGTLINPYVVEYKGTYYLQVFVETSSVPIYQIDEQVIDVAEINAFLPVKTEQPIVIRDIKFENIKHLIINNEEIQSIILPQT